MSDFANENTYEHRCRNGTVFKAERADWTKGVDVIVPDDIKIVHLCEDMAQNAAWHAAQVHPRLNGFSGYDCTRYRFVDKEGKPHMSLQGGRG